MRGRFVQYALRLALMISICPLQIFYKDMISQGHFHVAEVQVRCVFVGHELTEHLREVVDVSQHDALGGCCCAEPSPPVAVQDYTQMILTMIYK